MLGIKRCMFKCEELVDVKRGIFCTMTRFGLCYCRMWLIELDEQIATTHHNQTQWIILLVVACKDQSHLVCSLQILIVIMMAVWFLLLLRCGH